MEILREKNQFKLEHGFNPSALRIPKRILETDSPHGKVQESYLKEAVEEFYRLLASD